MLYRRIALARLVLALVMRAAPSMQAGAIVTSVDRVTFNQPVGRRGIVLVPGSYTFVAGLPGMSPNIVRVMSPDYQKQYFVGLTQIVRRPANMARNQVVTLGEAPAGAPTPIRAWYPIGAQSGHEFLYR